MGGFLFTLKVSHLSLMTVNSQHDKIARTQGKSSFPVTKSSNCAKTPFNVHSFLTPYDTPCHNLLSMWQERISYQLIKNLNNNFFFNMSGMLKETLANV